MDWRQRLYDGYMTSGQGGQDAANGYRSSAPFIKRIIARHIPTDRNTRILDLGCGAGGFIYWLKKAGYHRAAGIDFSPEMIAAAHQAGVDAVRYGDLRGELAATQTHSLDVVVAMDVLEHFDRPDLFAVCDEIVRVLRPSGRLIAHVPNAEGIFGARIRSGDLTHELAFTPSSMRQLLLTVGFCDVRCYEDTPIPHGLASAARAVIWRLGTAGFRVLHAAETGVIGCILSQNMLVTATLPPQ